MLITGEQFQAFLHCETKAYLKSAGTVAARHEFTDWRRRTEDDYKQKCLSRLRAEAWNEGCFAGTPSPNELKAKKYHLVMDCVLQAQEFESHIQATGKSRRCRECKAQPLHSDPVYSNRENHEFR